MAVREHALEKLVCGLQGACLPCRERLVGIAGDKKERLYDNDWIFWVLWLGISFALFR